MLDATAHAASSVNVAPRVKFSGSCNPPFMVSAIITDAGGSGLITNQLTLIGRSINFGSGWKEISGPLRNIFEIPISLSPGAYVGEIPAQSFEVGSHGVLFQISAWDNAANSGGSALFVFDGYQLIPMPISNSGANPMAIMYNVCYAQIVPSPVPSPISTLH
jgi:hypothetical protein